MCENCKMLVVEDRKTFQAEWEYLLVRLRYVAKRLGRPMPVTARSQIKKMQGVDSG